MKTRLTLFLAILAMAFHSNAQKSFWTIAPQKADIRVTSHWNKISNLRIVQLDHQAFRDYLAQNVPSESAKAQPVPILLPMPDGSMRRFYITESAVMEPELAAKFPEIKTYKGTDGLNVMRMSISPLSFQAYVLTDDGDIVIEAIDKKNLNQFGVFNSKDLQLDQPLPLSCGAKELSKINSPKVISNGNLHSRTNAGILGAPVDLRTYRLALACTGEWGGRADLGGGSVVSAIDKMNAALTYINAVYEKDVSIHMNLIANNDRLIFLDGTADPYLYPTVGGQILGVNTDVINAKLGNSGAYDFGHAFTISCSDVGGIAFLGCVCQGNKGGGVTCWYTSDIAYVSQRITCHEMGHQFDASHTFSNCNGNESSTSYEPGSGTSIMSYSGLCGALNVETSNLPHPNYFHTNSVERILNFSRNAGGASCGKASSTTNTFPEPEILIPSGLYIPIRTPFKLKGRARDMENDALTYTWEQYDAGGYGPAIGQPLLTEEGPLFKSLFPGPDSNRVVPSWNTVLTKGNFDVAEVLPTVSREINFRFTVRDNHPGSGGTAWKQTYFRALESAGPFTVTNPNYPQTDTLFTGLCNKVTWDVANTSSSLVNCQKVNIYLMPNRMTPTDIVPLALNTENDGEELVDIPANYANQTRARIIVEAADNIFFDVTDADIRIKAPTSEKLVFGVSPNNLKFCVPSQANIDIRSCASNLNGDLQLFVESGLPDKAIANFEKSTMNVSDQTKLHLDFSNVNTSGVSHLIVAAVTPNGDTLREDITLDLVSVDFSDLKTIYPADGLSGLNQSIEFKWATSINAISYKLEVATSPAFGNSVIYSIDGLTGSSFKPNFLFNENQLYYWRITPSNRCGLGSPTLSSPFHTVNKSCVSTIYPGNILTRRPNQTGSLLIPIKEAGIINDVNVKDFMADANFVSDVTLTLISPTGTRVRLFAGQCGNSGQFNCSFDDDGNYSFSNAPPGYNACPPINLKLIKPLESLSKFNGEDKKGDWRLEIACDANLSQVATFNTYTLDICSELIVNDPFLVNNLGLFMNKGETKNIGSNLLLSQDNDNGPAELKYTIVAITQKGDLLLNGNVANYGSQFTQKDIDDGRVSYHHKGQDQETDGFLFTVEDGNGGWFGSDYFKIQIGAVGTKDQSDDLGLRIYPNPTNGLLQISADRILDKHADLRIVNLQGQVLFKKDIGLQKADVINVSNLPDGVFLLEIRSGKYNSINKIVIKKGQ